MFELVNEIVSQYTTARHIPYTPEDLATTPESVYDTVVSFGFAFNDPHADYIAEVIRQYIMEA